MGYRKLGRPSAHRQLMLRNMVTSLLKNGRIETTETRAKEARKLADKMITLAKKGDLHQYIKYYKSNNKKFSDSELFNYFIQIAQGIKYLHKHNIIHRDIKTANIFIDHNNNLKLGDFGIIKILQNHSMQANTQIGTPCYMPPELYRYQRYNTKFDIWSLGCVLYEMMAFNPPFNGRSLVDLKYKIFSGKYNNQILRPYASELRYIVSLTLNTNPTLRPSIEQVLKLPALLSKLSILKLGLTLASISKLLSTSPPYAPIVSPTL